ncbi:sentrin-specific protease 7 isoform X1 [Pogona vitticeps]
MEECGKKPSVQQKYRIPKKGLNKDAQSDDVYVQSPLSRLPDAYQWENPLQGWTSGSRNKTYSSWKRKRHSENCSSDEGSAYGYGRQPKVILTNVLETEIGRKYIKAQLITDANLSHGVKLQTDQQTSSSVDSVEIWQILSPLRESLLISERQPKVTLTNVLRTKTGRQYMQRQLLNDLNVSDANMLQSDEQLSSSIANLESCQKISCQQSRILSKRYGRCHRMANDWKPPKDAKSNNALLTIRKCDVLLEDYFIKNEDWTEKRRKDPKYQTTNLKETHFRNSESRRQSDVSLNQCNSYSSQKSPLSNKEQMRERIPSPVCRSPNKNHKNNLQQENNPQLLEPVSGERFIPADNDTVASCPHENSSKSSSRREVHSITSKEKEMPPLVPVAKKQKIDITLPPEEPLNKPERSKEAADPVEPIVLSSDEDEGNVEAKDPEKYFQTGKGYGHKKKEKKQESELLVPEVLSQSVTESKTEQVSEELLALKSTADDSNLREQLDLALDIKFEMLFVGKYKGPATDCFRFTTRCIKIPFEVAHNKKIELSLDPMHLRRLGLWMNNDPSIVKHDFIIFLWLSSDYVGQIENKVGLSILNRQVKNTEHVFIKLLEPLTGEEHVMLNKILVEISKKNPSPDLTNSIPWEEVLQEISCEEDSCFMDYCYESFQQQLQKDSVSVLTETPPQQVSKASIPKPNYTVLQKQSNGQYSFSISSTKRSEWKELREAGPVQNLIIYPPPPAKGGLGVTREDLECLEHGEFLNDVIIDFYLKYLLLEKAPKELADRSHIFSSFFYKCLTRTEKTSEENPKLSLAQRRHRRVKRWTRYINIFNKDYIFVPVNEESHWYIAVICFPWLEEVVYEDSPGQCSQQSSLQQFPPQLEIRNETVKTESVLVFKDIKNDKEKSAVNSNVQPNGNIQASVISPELDSCSSKSTSSMSTHKKISKRPCILILDSLKASSVQNTIQLLREYLEAEWEAKRKTSREFSKSVMVDFCPRVPKQDNSSDCGLYLLQYVETFFQSPVVNFELPIHLERWFPRRIVRSKREEIRNLILQLHLQQQCGSKS